MDKAIAIAGHQLDARAVHTSHTKSTMHANDHKHTSRSMFGARSCTSEGCELKATPVPKMQICRNIPTRFRQQTHPSSTLPEEQTELEGGVALPDASKTKQTVLEPARKSFLSLPRELRDMVYEECIDLSGIGPNVANQLQNFYKEIRFINSHKHKKKVYQLLGRLGMRHGQGRCHTIFRVNRQIYEEAMEVLRSRTLTFVGPSNNNPEINPLSDMIGAGILRTVKETHFVMPMKQHSDATMLGEIQMGNNWYVHEYANESLDNARYWGQFLNFVLEMIWLPCDDHVQHIRVSIVNGKSSDISFTFKTNHANLEKLKSTVDKCLRTRNLEIFFDFLRLVSSTTPS